MSVNLVSAGAAAVGSTSASPSYGQTTAANHLLLAWATSNDSASSYPISISGVSGWVAAVETGVPYNWLGLYYKLGSLGSDNAPSFSDSGATYVAASLAEFSGLDLGELGGLDESGSQAEYANVTADAVDRHAGDLIVATYSWNGSNADPTLGLTIYGSDGNAATTSVMVTGEGSSPPFFIFGYAIGPSTLGSSANLAEATSSAFENAPAGIVASFKAS